MRRAWAIVGLSLSLFACATSMGSPRAEPSPKPAWKRSCTEYARAPVRIDYEDASGGAALVYRTRGDVTALRQRTLEVAEFHNSTGSKIGALHDLFAIPHRAYVEEVKGGTKLILVPKGVRPQQLDALRVQVQQETLNMRRRGCGTGQEAL
jgi:hypothetical protein